MVGHTGFLCTSRRLADGVEPPLRRRRPSTGMYGETLAESVAPDGTPKEPFRPDLP
jgi:tRNA (adenine57-N1/adenine58-N1)-methyltransferase